MIKFVLGNPGKALWMLLFILAIAFLEKSPQINFLLFGWALFPPCVLSHCEKKNIPHKWRWAVANFLLPWIGACIFIFFTAVKDVADLKQKRGH